MFLLHGSRQLSLLFLPWESRCFWPEIAKQLSQVHSLLAWAWAAEVDLIPYLASRYFGLRDFGKVYSSLFAAFALSGAVGPLIMGAGFDRTGSYIRPLVGFFVAILLATVLMTRLGPYRFRPRESNDDYLKHKVAQELRVQREDQCL